MDVSFNLSIPNFFGINRTVRATVRFTIFQILILILRGKNKKAFVPCEGGNSGSNSSAGGLENPPKSVAGNCDWIKGFVSWSALALWNRFLAWATAGTSSSSGDVLMLISSGKREGERRRISSKKPHFCFSKNAVKHFKIDIQFNNSFQKI